MSDVMNEPAVWFFSMLKEAYKLRAREIQDSSVAASVPHMKDTDRRKYFKSLESAQRDIIIGENNDYSGLEKLKKELNGGN